MANEILDNNFGDLNKDSYAGFWIRFVASLLDFLVLLPLIALTIYNNFGLKSLPLMIVLSVAVAVYKPLMEGKYGYTLGKKMLGLRIIDENSNQINMKQALIRWIPWAINSVIALIAAINLFNHEGFQEATTFMEVNLLQKDDIFTLINNFFSIVFIIMAFTVGLDKNKQGFHDKMAETFVVKEN